MRCTVVGLLLVAGCAAPAPAPESSVEPPPGLSVSLAQSRDNENRHLLQVLLRNDGPAPVEVTRLQLRSPAFERVPPTERSDVVRPGRRLAFPIAYGAADCERDGPAQVALGFSRDGRTQQALLEVPADDPLLGRLRERECGLRELARTAVVGFAPDWQRQGRAALGRLVVRRVGGTAGVRVTSVEGTVLLTLRPQGPLPLVLDGETAELPVVVTASRCDPHALTESKRTYDFPYYAALGDGEPAYATVRPEAAGLAVLERLLRETCAGG